MTRVQNIGIALVDLHGIDQLSQAVFFYHSVHTCAP